MIIIISIIHLQVDEVEKLGTITAYNLTSRAQTVEIKLDLLKYGLEISTIDIYNGVNQKVMNTDLPFNSDNNFILDIEIPSLSPLIVLLKR